jgi:hypothetical protein
MKRIYHNIPSNPDFEQRYDFKGDLPYIVRTMAEMDGKFGSFITDSPDLKGKSIEAKRDIKVEITNKSIEFFPLNKNTVNSVLNDIKKEGTIDFRVALKYSFLDAHYNRIPFKGDSFLVRTSLEKGVLTIKVHHMDGMGRTQPSRIADTIIDEIIRTEPDV